MAETSLRHKLAAVLAADAAGYSKLMQADEPATIAELDACREIFRRQIEDHHGRVVDMAGDSVLAEFETATGAIRAALAIQTEIAGRISSLPEGRRMLFRIGINLGETIGKADGTIYGDGVKLAARLQTLAEPGTVCVSEAVAAQARGRLDATFVAMGVHAVKNIAEPVRAFRVAPVGASVKSSRLTPGWPRKRAAIALGAVALILGVGATVWYLHLGAVPSADSSSASPSPILALPKGPSIAVLPFANLSGDPGQEYFTDGITEEIITELTRFHDLFVIGRNSTLKYKAKAADVRDVGRDLGVRYVLEGSMRRSSGRIRVTAQLLDASNGAHLWAENYDRDLTAEDLFAIQDEITRHVVATVAQPYGVISRSAMSAVKAKRPESLSAYECVLRYWSYEETLTAAEHLRMRECLESAVQAEPQYAEAWALLSSTYRHEALFQFNPRSDAPPPLDRALFAAQHAVELDPRNEIARVFLAVVHFQRREFDAFVREEERALVLSPNNSYILAAAGMWFTCMGQSDRGVALIKKAQTLNPYHPGWYHFPLALSHYSKGEYERAAAEFSAINTPGWYQMHAGLAASYGQLGRTEEARAAAKALLERKPDFLTDPRHFYRTRNIPHEVGERLMDGLRKAGLDIPPETP